nr:hypothetical protein [Candidatus Phytoplasma sacchari]KAB8122706.1 hypothetical protein F2B49_00840 [Candidatus Phytoplasma sacchari]
MNFNLKRIKLLKNIFLLFIVFCFFSFELIQKKIKSNKVFALGKKDFFKTIILSLDQTKRITAVNIEEKIHKIEYKRKEQEKIKKNKKRFLIENIESKRQKEYFLLSIIFPKYE